MKGVQLSSSLTFTLHPNLNGRVIRCIVAHFLAPLVVTEFPIVVYCKPISFSELILCIIFLYYA